MTPLVDKVARAIYDTCPTFMSAGLSIETLKQIHWDELDERDREEAREAAQAAIKAVLEAQIEFQSEEMMNAFRCAGGDEFREAIEIFARENNITLQDSER